MSAVGKAPTYFFRFKRGSVGIQGTADKKCRSVLQTRFRSVAVCSDISNHWQMPEVHCRLSPLNKAWGDSRCTWAKRSADYPTEQSITLAIGERPLKLL